jgi:hydroxymethylglutaryl-CoA lyase
LDRAVCAGFKRIAVITAASDTFAKKNIHMTVDESLIEIAKVVEKSRQHGLSVRGYLSTSFVCPFEGEIDKTRVRSVAERLLQIGVDEVAISDTLGAAAPTDIRETVGFLLETVPASKIALHLHDTYGTALANVVAGLELGIITFDSSAGGLGGCPYAPGALGNLATEDLVYLLDRMGIETGVDLVKVVEAGEVVAKTLGRPLSSRQWHRLKNCCRS